jgi:hypothetical protein
MASCEQFLSSFDAAPERGKQFERFVKSFLKTVRHRDGDVETLQATSGLLPNASWRHQMVKDASAGCRSFVPATLSRDTLGS